MAELRHLDEKGKNSSPIRIIKSKLNSDFPISLILSIIILVLAIYVKLLLSNWIGSWIYHDDTWYFYYTFEHPVKGEITWYFENYGDSNYYYESYLYEFRYSGWNPYLRYENELDFYLYGPVFIYGLYFTSLFVSAINPGLGGHAVSEIAVKWTAINFDALSVVMVYLIIISLKSFKENKYLRHVFGVVGAAIFTCAPMNLLYIDTIYLNIPQMTFFTLLTIYLFLQEKYRLSAYALTLAWLTKQMPLFLVIPLFSMIWKKYDLKFAIKKFLRPFLVSTFLISIPWIFITPLLYVGRIIAAGRSLWYVDLNATKHGVTFAHTLLYMGSKPLATFYVWINIPMIPFLLTYLFSLFVTHFNGKKIISDEYHFLINIAWIIAITHTFISRGIYKYYDAFINPFVIICSVIGVERFIRKIKVKRLNESEKQKLHALKQDKLSLLESSFLVIGVIVLGAGIYYFNWAIMIYSRFIHPVFLLGLVLMITTFIPRSFHKEVFRKQNYRILKEDFKSFFKYVKISFVNSYKSVISFFKKLYNWTISVFRKKKE